MAEGPSGEWKSAGRWVWVVVAALSLPILGMGFMMDDYAQLALVEPWHPSNAGLFDLYDFLDRLPLDPWWKHPELEVRMYRPLPSLLLRLDNWLFGSWAVGYHLHSLLWYFALLWVCAALYRRVLGGGVAILATLIFALDECHLLTATWIANRHSMVAMVPALLGLLAHLRWRDEAWKPGLPWSLLGYGVALLGGEMALGVMAYGVAYELLSPPSGRRRLAALVPLGTLALVYALAYRAMAYGASHSGFYLDPVGSPGSFLLAASGHLPTLLAAAFVGLPSDLWFFVPRLRGLQVVVGLLAFGVFAAWVWRARADFSSAEQRALRWLVAGVLLSLLPVAAAQPFDRVLIVPMLGLAPLLALLARWLWRRSMQAGQKRLMVLALVALLSIHLALPFVSRAVGQWLMARQWVAIHRLATGLPISALDAPRRDVIVLNAPDIIIGGFLPLIYGFENRCYFRSWQVLSLAPYDHRLHRTGARAFELEVLGGSLLGTPAEQFHRRADEPLVPGERIVTPFFEVEILEVDSVGPRRAVFALNRELEAPDLVFLVWNGESMARLGMPPPGESSIVPHHAGAMRFAFD